MEGQSRETGWWGPPRKWERARGLGSQITRFSGKQEMGIYKPKSQMMFSLYLFPTPSPENRSSPGPENLSLPPWSLGDFEQLVTSLTLHDPNIFGPQ